MTSLDEATFNNIKNKYEQLIKLAKQEINEELSRICKSSRDRCEDNKLKLQTLKCVFPLSCPKAEQLDAKQFVKIVGGNNASVLVQCKVLEAVERLPRMQAYLPLQRNILVDQESIFDRNPYFGEDDDGKFIKDLKAKNKPKEKIHQEELPLIDEIIFKDLAEHSLDLLDGAVFEGEINVYEAIARILRAKSSPQELRSKFKSLGKEEKPRTLQSIDNHESSENNFEQTLQTFQSKFCCRCFFYNCLLHKEPLMPKTNRSKHYGVQISKEPCSEHCYKNEDNDEGVSMVDAGSHDEVWSGSDISLFNVLRQTFGNDSCYIADILKVKTCRQVEAFAKKLNESAAGGSGDIQDFVGDKIIKKKPGTSKALKKKALRTNAKIKKAGCECQINCQMSSNHTCKNASIQRGMKKHLLLGKSDVSGWGVFTKNVIEKNEFISEYCGEVIPEDEAELRAKIYDKLGSNFIFKLTDEHSIDSTRKGNKIRFSNHSENPNCYARRVYSNGNYHIAYYAKRKIEANEELLVDYGDSYSVHFEQLKKSAKIKKEKK